MKIERKVAILTIDAKNYGNRLQNFALHKILRDMGLVPYNIKNYIKNRTVKQCVRDLFIYDSYSNYRKFNKRMLEASELINSEGVFGDYDQYEAIIVGSDQIWNMSFDFISVNDFLPFYHKNKISFAASFGISEIEYDNTVVKCLQDFKCLSVREESAAKIVKKISGRDATILIDPTMLLNRYEWQKASKRPRGAKEGYILTYFLSPKCDAAKNLLDEIKCDRIVYELLDNDDTVAGTAGPSEFLWLFDHAEFILTDSFHACVFSFLFNKPFVVYDRNWDEGNMNSRLETLLSKFHLERKYANSGLENNILEHDYEEGYKQLEIERKKAMDFLKNALEE